MAASIVAALASAYCANLFKYSVRLKKAISAALLRDTFALLSKAATLYRKSLSFVPLPPFTIK